MALPNSILHRALPTPGVANARGRVPRNSQNLVERLLNPDGIMIVEVDNSSQRFTIIEVILDLRQSGETRDARLNPRVPGHALRLWQTEILHESKALCIGSEVGMPKARAGILVHICKRQFISKRILFQKAEGVADSDVVVRFGHPTWTVKVRPKHDKKIGARAARRLRTGWICRLWRVLGSAHWRQQKR